MESGEHGRHRRPLVLKFGGSSVADAGRLGHVARLVADEAAHAPPVVVVSALAGVTDALVELDRAAGEGPGAAIEDRVEAIRRRHLAVLAELGEGDAEGTVACVGALESTLATLERTVRAAAGAGADSDRGKAEETGDAVRAAGDTLAAHLLARALQMRGAAGRFVDARRVIRTDARFGRARPDEAALASLARAELAPLLDRGVIPVVPGFVGATPEGRTTTLGRGGSDYTATLLGAALDAREVHIWTDVDGVLSGDPRTVSAPRPLEVMGFEETVELAHFGARVLHPGAAKHAVSRGLTVRIRSTFTPERPGSLILRERVGPAEIAAVAFKEAVALIKVRSHPSAMPYGFLARVFEILARHRLPVDLVATSHTSTAFTLDGHEDVSGAAAELEDFADVRVAEGLATVTVVGRGLMDAPGINARVFEAVGRTPVHLVSQASDVSLSLVVDADEARELVRRLHAALVEDAARHSAAEGTRRGPAEGVEEGE
jgi:aspartate kinase